MKLKKLLMSLAAASASFGLFAQTQGYQDGIEYFKVDQFDNAKEIITNHLQSPETDRATALYYLGAIALEQGDVVTAKANFDEGISLDPKNGLNYVGLGAIDLKSGNLKAAVDQFKAATKAQNKAPIYVAIARTYYNADPVAYANEYAKYIDEAKKKDKKCPDIYVMQGDVLRDQAVAAGIDDGTAIGQAASEYSQAIYFDPNSPEAYVKYSRLYATANPQYAIDKLNEYIGLNPQSAMVQRELAERYYDSDQWTRAAQQYGKYIENPNHFASDVERYAVLLYFGENYDKSLDIARQQLAQNPNSLQLKRMIFLNLEKKGDYAGAKTAADEFFATPLTQNQRFTANDYSTYADILDELGETEGELNARRKAVEAAPDKADLYKALGSAYSAVGGDAFRAGDTIKANQNYVEALAAYMLYMEKKGADNLITQDHIDLSNRYQNVASTSPADSPERTEAFEKALSEINIAVEEAPNHFLPIRTKARLLIVTNGNQPNEQSTEAYTKLLEVLDAEPDNKTKRVSDYKEAYNFIASYYIAQKDPATAKTWYLKFLEIDPTNDALREFIDTKL